MGTAPEALYGKHRVFAPKMNVPFLQLVGDAFHVGNALELHVRLVCVLYTETPESAAGNREKGQNRCICQSRQMRRVKDTQARLSRISQKMGSSCD